MDKDDLVARCDIPIGSDSPSFGGMPQTSLFPRIELFNPSVSWTFRREYKQILYLDQVKGSDVDNIVFTVRVANRQTQALVVPEREVTSDRVLLDLNKHHTNLSNCDAVLCAYFRNGVSSGLGRDLGDLLKAETFCDVSLHVQQPKVGTSAESVTILKAHRAVLSARSPVFERILSSDMSEGRTGSVSVEFDVDVVRILLQYIYTGVATGLSEKNALGVLAAADYYDIEDLKPMCEKRLLKHIDCNNAIETLVFADEVDATNIKRRAIDVIAANLKEVRGTSLWKVFLKEHTELVDEVLEVVSTSSVKEKATNKTTASNSTTGSEKKPAAYKPCFEKGQKVFAVYQFKYSTRSNTFPRFGLEYPNVSWTIKVDDGRGAFFGTGSGQGKLLLHNLEGEDAGKVRFRVQVSSKSNLAEQLGPELDVQADCVLLSPAAAQSSSTSAGSHSLTTDTVEYTIRLSLLFKHDEYITWLGEHLEKALKSGKGSDFLLVIPKSDTTAAEECRIPTHRVILSARSPTFRRHLSQQQSGGKGSYVLPSDFAPAAVNTVLTYAYAGYASGLDEDHGDGTSMDVLKVAQFFGLIDLHGLCEDGLLQDLAPSNAIRLLVHADSHNAPRLKRRAIESVIADLKQVRSSTDWRPFLESHTSLVDEIMTVMQEKLIDMLAAKSPPSTLRNTAL